MIGEANFSDHGANRLGASALMQGLADGYFVLPTTIGDYLARGVDPVSADAPEVKAVEAEVSGRIETLLSIDGSRTVDSFHRELGHLMWDHCGMERTEEGLTKALERIPELRREFWSSVQVPGAAATLNQSLEKAGRVADFLELGELMCLDALATPRILRRPLPGRGVPDRRRRGASRRRQFSAYVAAWEYQGPGKKPRPPQVEPLAFENVHPQPDPELQVAMKLTLHVWRQDGTRPTRAGS